MTAFRDVLQLWLRRPAFRRCRGRIAKFGNRAQHFAPIAENYADLLQVLIGQVGKDGEVNAVFSKPLGILGHPELFEPVRNLLHHGPASSDVPGPRRTEV